MDKTTLHELLTSNTLYNFLQIFIFTSKYADIFREKMTWNQ